MGRERSLGLLMLRCETTGTLIRSGVPFTQNDLDRVRPAKIHLQCPACGELHGFSFSNAWIADAEERPVSGGAAEPGSDRGRQRR